MPLFLSANVCNHLFYAASMPDLLKFVCTYNLSYHFSTPKIVLGNMCSSILKLSASRCRRGGAGSHCFKLEVRFAIDLTNLQHFYFSDNIYNSFHTVMILSILTTSNFSHQSTFQYPFFFAPTRSTYPFAFRKVILFSTAVSLIPSIL